MCLAMTTTHTYMTTTHTYMTTTHTYQMRLSCDNTHIKCVCHVPCYDHKVRGEWEAQDKGNCLKTTRHKALSQDHASQGTVSRPRVSRQLSQDHASQGNCLKTTRLKATVSRPRVSRQLSQDLASQGVPLCKEMNDSGLSNQCAKRSMCVCAMCVYAKQSMCVYAHQSMIECTPIN